MIEFLTSGTFRRIIAALLGVLVPFLNKKFDLGLSEANIAEAIVVVVAYIAQSGWKEGSQLKADAHVEAAKAVAAGAAETPKP